MSHLDHGGRLLSSEDTRPIGHCLVYLLFQICYVISMLISISQGDEKGMLGEDVTLRCNTSENEDVLQVTWQKNTRSSPENIGSYSTQFGVVIQDPYKARFNIIEKKLTKSAITITRTELKDEGCFLCVFNTFPSGAVNKKICLRLYALPIPTLQSNITSAGHLEATCSASGYPAPTIMWHGAGEQGNTTQQNPNGTILVNSWLRINKTRSNEGENISCIVTHPELQKPMYLYVKMQKEESQSSTAAIIIAIIIITAIIVVAALCIMKQKCWKPCDKERVV